MGREAERGAGGQPAAGRESRWEPRWKRYPAAERWLADRLGELAEESPPLRRLERELAERTGSRLADWVDHLVLEDGEEPRAALRKNGFRPEEAGGAAGAGDAADGAAGPDGRLFHHPGALFPRVALRATGGAAAGTTLAAALGVEQATRFLMVQGIAAPVEGSPLASCRRAQVWRSAAAAGKAARELWVVERRGAWSLLPQEEPPGAARRYLEASERWATRQRVFADPREGLERTLERARELAGELGQPRAAWVIFEAERAYWQGRSRAGRIQKARQDSAGMGWANHDHHTFRSSRQTFGTLIRLLEALGFQPRERFYAGEQAGWGAQILEHPGCGLTVFADVDLSPQEVGVDFAHQPLEPREKLGTVGLWCALHGESGLRAHRRRAGGEVRPRRSHRQPPGGHPARRRLQGIQPPIGERHHPAHRPAPGRIGPAAGATARRGEGSLMKGPRIRTRLPGPRAEALIGVDEQYVSPSYTRAYPLVAARGRDVWIEDVDGNVFLDFTAGIAVCATGHCHPRVVAAVRKQAGRLLHMATADFYHPPQVLLARRLAALAPGADQKKVFFSNSGAEAVEGAFKLARWHTRRHLNLAFFGAFHGRTMGALSLTASKAVQKKHYSPLIPGITHIPYPYCYRCPFGESCDRCRLACVRWVEETLFRTTLPPEEVAAIFAEPVQGEGGYIVPPAGFHRELQETARRYGILYVVDEVQTGMGRTGRMFAVEHFGVEPDILALAKGVASGLPLGVTVARAPIMDWEAGSHASTFGGNPVSCRAALVTLDLLEEGLVANAARQGERLLGRLRKLQAAHEWIGEVRGLGLMAAIELVTDRRTREPAAALRDRVVAEAFRRGLLLLGCGPSSIRFSPALTVTAEHIGTAIAILEEALRAASREGPG